MKYLWIMAAMSLLPVVAAAQTGLPTGTILPVSLSSALNTSKVHAGQQIRAEIMQDIPGTSIHRRAKLLGHVVNVTSAGNGQARLEIVFDAVETHGERIPVKTDLRALASVLEVEEAQVPEEEASRGIS